MLFLVLDALGDFCSLVISLCDSVPHLIRVFDWFNMYYGHSKFFVACVYGTSAHANGVIFDVR